MKEAVSDGCRHAFFFFLFVRQQLRQLRQLILLGGRQSPDHVLGHVLAGRE